MRIRRTASIAAAGVLLCLSLATAFAAYMGHNDNDSGLFLQAYPGMKGTVADDCSLCHAQGANPMPGSKKAAILNSCDFCHVVLFEKKGSPSETLNSFGKDYLKAGRNIDAFAKLESLDSDGDGFVNIYEMRAGTNPGGKDNSPALKTAPSVVLSLDGLRAKNLPVLDQSIFINVTKSKEGDSYSDFRGFRLIDVLEAAGMAKNAQSVDIISIDGYTHTFSIAGLRKSHKQAAPVFGLDKGTLGECGWVRYEAKGLAEGTPLPPADVLLTFEQGGKPYDKAYIDAESGKLKNSGPFRVVGPQMRSPGPPDVSRYADAACVEKTPAVYRFHEDYEKNSDYCVKATVAIRINPLPAGTRDFDWRKVQDDLINNSEIVIFGDLMP